MSQLAVPTPIQRGASAWWTGSVAALNSTPADDIAAVLSYRAAGNFRTGEQQQLRAWRMQIPLLRSALAGVRQPDDWVVLLEYAIPRFNRRADAILLCPRGVLVIEFKIGAAAFQTGDRQQADDLALDLQDFHAGSRRHPIVPILVAELAPARPQPIPLLIGGATAVLEANGETLASLIAHLDSALPDRQPPLDTQGWAEAPYGAAPGIVDAACTLYRGHDVAEIASAGADATNLTLTASAIGAELENAARAGEKLVLFVTGIPGAGKTLCGLNAAFSAPADRPASFLTGNPTLVHVLREALVRSTARTPGERRAAAQRMKSVIQALPAFRDLYVRRGDAPPERVVVVDEAQRSWSETYAIRKSRDREVPLSQSEPAHLLDIMARHEGFAALVCLIGNGQEIHDGEGGLAEWGEALSTRPEWQVRAAAKTLTDPEPRQRLPSLPSMRTRAELHLTVATRSLRSPLAPGWVDAVLSGDAARARDIADADGALPFRLTRDLAALRDGLRLACRGIHRAGLVASAGARRLRAEGLGAELPHMDPDAVARWFLDRFPADIRASDALDTVATQFSVQGLELDYVGLCWDGDLVRVPCQTDWQVRSLSGTAWQVQRAAEKIANRLNTYRVLLTRARYETIIWIPRGDAADRTRDPAVLDDVAAFLVSCGARALAATATTNTREEPAAGLFAG